MTLRQLCAFFYADHEKGLFECKMCGRGRKQASETGNSNLIDHLGTKHAGYVEEYAEIEATAASTMVMFGFVDDVTITIYLWMRWIIQRNLPITEV
ncbi:hypothetical protein PC129_g19663 [Phytophthora cactorum]|uniref:BED-type domain-containing protein n=1 Tax=Phytophthora cactorum TaxID=29920 RepID=A0A329SWC2_9STRA|nr:hypothetical protein Pcac1_g7125 [Phytophthora cactorum]KAG2803392.1 hypothetical protein PC112_g19190 [Phytophthora cactorum]KAG2804401.1 hypothetical protein PC111_g18274 [Phytophthora cactorum]KAG2841185.1 hypothetical protein PC113_g19095 [Phytophthora cactorum]KAG2882615.1 hypothetical protein PC114_g20947 [Phytophthora cactorum]